MKAKPHPDRSGATRRQFLLGGGAFLGSLALLPAVATAVLARTQPSVSPLPKGPTGPPWDSLRKEISGGILRPGDSGYAMAAAPWNQCYATTTPGAVARCKTPADVEAALFWAQRHRVPLVARAGGHSYAGGSSTTGLMLDLSGLNAVTLDEESRAVTVQGGARMQDVVGHLRQAGLAITHSRCLAVGLSGMLLGGGTGLNMRRHGLLCDQLLETQMVTADGMSRLADRKSNPDLFWASRGGGGGNFGINTSFQVEAFAVDRLTVFKLRWTSDLEDVLPTLLSILTGADDRLGAEVALTVDKDGTLSLTLEGQFEGPREEVVNLLDPVSRMARVASTMIEELPYWEAQDHLLEVAKPGFSRTRSRFAHAELPIEAADLILGSFARWPGCDGRARWKAALVGGAVDNVQRRATAYVHRGAQWLTSLELSWSTRDGEQRVTENLAWMDQLHLALEPYTSLESSQNILDPSDAQFPVACYGENLRHLVTLKKRYDPDNVFTAPHGIPTELS